MPLFHRTRTDGATVDVEHIASVLSSEQGRTQLSSSSAEEATATLTSHLHRRPSRTSIKTNNVHVRCECDINAPPLRRRRPVSSVTAAFNHISRDVLQHRSACAQSLEFYATRSSAIAEGLRDASCQLKACQLLRNSAETTCTTSPGQIEVMKLEGYSGPMCNKHV